MRQKLCLEQRWSQLRPAYLLHILCESCDTMIRSSRLIWHSESRRPLILKAAESDCGDTTIIEAGLYNLKKGSVSPKWCIREIHQRSCHSRRHCNSRGSFTAVFKKVVGTHFFFCSFWPHRRAFQPSATAEATRHQS